MTSMQNAVRDRWLICTVAGLRAVAVGLAGVIFALYLSIAGEPPWKIGLLLSLGLAGCAVATSIVMVMADRLGRRTTLMVIIALMALGGVVLAVTSTPSLIMLGTFIGMVNGMGRDRGAGLTIEQAMLPHTTRDAQRTAVFAWYNLIVDGGHALGALVAGLPAIFRTHMGAAPLASYQWTWGCYSV